MLASFEGFERPFEVEAVGKGVVDGVYGGVVDEILDTALDVVRFHSSWVDVDLTIVCVMYNRDIIFLRIFSCSIDVSGCNSGNDDFSM